MRLKVTPQVRVIVDPSDARRDYYLPQRIAEGALAAGLLAWDETNQCFAERPTIGAIITGCLPA
jgi:hypothetical protein